MAILRQGHVRRILGLFWFDLVWFAAVAGRDQWLLVTALLVAVQVVMSWQSGLLQWRTFAQLMVLGLALEATAIGLGVISFNGGWLPLWLVLLWAGFVAMLLNTLDWLAGRWLAALILGVASGPLTYAIGVRLDAAELLRPEWQMWLVYALLWGIYMVIFAKFLELKRGKADEPQSIDQTTS